MLVSDPRNAEETGEFKRMKFVSVDLIQRLMIVHFLNFDVVHVVLTQVIQHFVKVSEVLTFMIIPRFVFIEIQLLFAKITP